VIGDDAIVIRDRDRSIAITIGDRSIEKKSSRARKTIDTDHSARTLVCE
jgi:hypothetical protein